MRKVKICPNCQYYCAINLFNCPKCQADLNDVESIVIDTLDEYAVKKESVVPINEIKIKKVSLEKIKICPNCKTINASNELFCTNCATNLIEVEDINPSTTSINNDYIILATKDKNIEIDLSKGFNYLGRNFNYNLIFLNDYQVSGIHCLLFKINKIYYLQDVSSNGTYLNNQRIEPRQLKPLKQGDVITIIDNDIIIKTLN